MAETRIYGYARVSTLDQNLDRQLAALKNYISDERNIITEKRSGKDFARPNYQMLRNSILRSGDTLYITALDRLGRNKNEIKKELQFFHDNGIIVRVLDIPTTLMDFSQFGELQRSIMDMINNVLIEVLGTMAEQELTIKKQRQSEGIAAAKAKGKHLGRKPAEYPSDWSVVYAEWKQGNITAKIAMEKLGMKRTTFYKLVKLYQAKQ